MRNLLGHWHFHDHVKKQTCEYKMQPAYHWACENMLGMDGMVLCGAIWPITGEKLGSNTDFCVFYVQFIIFSAPEVSRIAFWGCSKMSIFWRILAKMGDDQTLKADFSMKTIFFSNFLNVTRFVLSWKAQNRGLLRKTLQTKKVYNQENDIWFPLSHNIFQQNSTWLYAPWREELKTVEFLKIGA